MVYNKNMVRAIMVAVLFVAASAWASEPSALSLPTVAHADTEVVTNVVISSWQRGAAKFAFSLSCLATPSNNVEAASRIESVKCKV